MAGVDERTELIGLIYEAALDRRVWPLVADRLADLMGAAACQITTHDVRTGAVVEVAPRVPPEALALYGNSWAHHNPLIAAGRRMPVGSVFSNHDLVPKDDFARTAIYNEFFAPLELDEAIGGTLAVDGPFSASFGVWRPARLDVFDRSDRALLGGLIPHLQRALQLNVRLAELEMARAASVELLDRLRQASLLVDAGCRVLFANRPAEEILAHRIRPAARCRFGIARRPARRHRRAAQACRQSGQARCRWRG